MRGQRLLLLGIAAMLAARHAGAIQATIGGRQIDLDTTLSVREVIEENHATTHERTRQELRVRAAVSLADWLRFDSTTVASNGGPTLKSDRAGIYTWDDAFQDVSPALEFGEAYFDVFLPSLDLRLGKQKVAWGKLDRMQPNDLINPLTYFDPLVQDEAERKIGVPALQASYYLPAAPAVPPESRLTAVWVAKYIPYRFPLADCRVESGVSRCDVERWFPPAGLPPSTFTVPLPNGSPLTVPLSFRTHNVSPAWRLENSELGLRYSALVRDVDFAFYYFHGFDAQPAFRLSAQAVGEPDPASPLGVKADLSGATMLAPEFRHVDSWGADFAYPFDRFAVRAEGVFVRGRPFSRDVRLLLSDGSVLAPQIPMILRDLAHGAGRVDVRLPDSFVVHDAVEWGVGGDYTYEGYVLLLQVNQTDVLHNTADLLIKDVETRVLANVRKSFLSETVQTQLIAIHAIESDYSFVRPRLMYKFTDHIAGEVGYLFIAGRAHSVGGQFRRNDEGFVRLEYKL